MNIVVYRNRVDNDIKKISRFVNELESKLECSNVSIRVVQGGGKRSTMEALLSADIIIIFSHGEEDKIYYKLSSRMDMGNDDDTLIDLNNIFEFSKKKVIVFACKTAKKLGPYAVKEAGIISYVGFDDTIDYALAEARYNSPIIINFFYTIYAEVFEELLVTALNNNLTPDKMRKFFNEKMSKKIICLSELNAEDNIKFDHKLLPQVFKVLSKTSSALQVMGNTKTGIIA